MEPAAVTPLVVNAPPGRDRADVSGVRRHGREIELQIPKIRLEHSFPPLRAASAL
jgi:hypothetical protein